MKKCINIEYICFILLFFLQNFALIRTANFGINGLVCFLFLLTIVKGKKYYSKYNKKLFVLLIGTISFLFISSFVNNTYYVTQILRYIMTIWLIYVSNIYIKDVFENGNGVKFLKIYSTILLIFLLYGIYELIAIKFTLPLYLNVFGNNPSYQVKTLDGYYAGWVETPRLYNSFAEPSYFSIFLVYNFFFIKEIKEINTNKKIILLILIIYNLIFTYARTGYVVMIYMICIYILYNIVLKNNKKIRIIDFIVLLLPFINMLVMYFVGLYLFDDLSSLSRTYSAIYYLQHSFDSIKNMLFGHSTGSVINAIVTQLYVEKHAHNGYIDIIFQFGIVVFGIFFKFLYDRVRKITQKRYLIIGVLATFCCFASYFCVETIMVQVIIIYNYCKYESLSEKNK